MQTAVKSLMTGAPVSIAPDASALAALDLMQEHGIRHLPVIDPERQVIGVLSIDDLRAAFPIPVTLQRAPSVEERGVLKDLVVAEVMSFAPETVVAETPLAQAAQRMADRRIGCLPVVDERGCLEGILSETDVLHALATVLWTDHVRERAAVPSTTEFLRDERDRLLEKLGAYARTERELTELRREAPLDLPEHAADAQEAFLTEDLAKFAAQRLRALEHALRRAETGSLDTCERCGGRIASARLRALPEAALCIRCARAHEER